VEEGIKMNWVGRLVKKEVCCDDTVLYLGCGLMQDIGSELSPEDGWLTCKHIIGVDIFRQYLEHIKHLNNVSVINLDINNLSMFLDRSFDVVIALDVVEHFEEKDAYKLISEMERIARKKVIILTPCKFDKNVEATEGKTETGLYRNFGPNIYLLHRCLIKFEWLMNNGYNVREVNAEKDNPNYYSFAVKVIK